MKNILPALLVLTLISCNHLSKEVENSFSTMSMKMESLNKIEENKIENHFKEINSKQIEEHDAENFELIYYSVIEHNQVIDSLINELRSAEKNKPGKKKIIEKYQYVKSDLRNKLNSITEFQTKITVDSLLKPVDDIEIMPQFALITEFQSGKLNASKGAELLLSKLNDKIKNEAELNKANHNND